jgi:DNA-directed RNA polymerase subunit H (RpoH/RPB5)
MDSELIDLFIRTRPVILSILELRGYNTAPYAGESPEDLRVMTSDVKNLTVTLERKGEATAPRPKCHVLYWIDAPARLRVNNLVTKLFSVEDAPYKAAEDEIMVILSEPFHDIFHHQAIKGYAEGTLISFYNIRNLVSNPAHHVAVPPHRKLSKEETESVMTKLHIRNKNEFPRIIFHVDMQARVLGLLPGDVVEIRRPSPTSGEYLSYRVCSVA